MFNQNSNKTNTQKKEKQKRICDKLTIIIISSILNFVDVMTDTNLPEARIANGLFMLDVVILMGLIIALRFSNAW